MRVTNTSELNAPVILQYQGNKITIPKDGMIYFIPDFFRGKQFKGLLRVIPDDVPLCRDYYKANNVIKVNGVLTKQEPKPPEPIEAFPECIYKEPDFSEFEGVEITPQNPEYFPSYIRDKDDPTVLIDVKDAPTITERREEMKNEEKPLKKIKISKKIRADKKKERHEKFYGSSVNNS